MQVALNGSAAVAEQHKWHSPVGVHVRVTQRAGIKDQRMIQETAVAIRCFSHFVGEVTEQRMVIRVDFRQFFDSSGYLSVMRRRMPGDGHSAFREDAV